MMNRYRVAAELKIKSDFLVEFWLRAQNLMARREQFQLAQFLHTAYRNT